MEAFTSDALCEAFNPYPGIQMTHEEDDAYF
jgi:hypothetical protein